MDDEVGVVSDQALSHSCYILERKSLLDELLSLVDHVEA